MPLYIALRPFFGDEGTARKGQVLDLTEERAKGLGSLVKPHDGKAEPAPTKQAEAPVNKMEPPPPATAVEVPTVTKVRKSRAKPVEPTPETEG